ncbi:hypothetical protein BH10PSE12_BH10PSE12_01030 [soil metagenome]
MQGRPTLMRPFVSSAVETHWRTLQIMSLDCARDERGFQA